MFRLLYVVDDYNWELLAIEVDKSLSTFRVIGLFKWIFELRRKPGSTRIDNGSEFINEKLKAWGYEMGIRLIST